MADQINDGGPAYPFLELDGAGMPYQQNPGMTLRDAFAMRAMPQIMAERHDGTDDGPKGSRWDMHEVALLAYAQADAMLKERTK